MLTLTEIFAILIIHWFADFVMQTDKQAKGKSKNWDDLLCHTFTYSIVWWSVGISYIAYYFDSIKYVDGLLVLMIFTFVTFGLHTITDYYTSRLNSKLWSEGKVHNFFVSVGFDQVLHYIQLFLTYYLLK